MRTLKRNKRPVAYARYAGVQELTDALGNYTGEYAVSYTEPVKTLMNVSGGRGQADIALFGLTDTFSRTATYRVVAVSRTINQVVIALAEVEHDENDNP